MVKKPDSPISRLGKKSWWRETKRSWSRKWLSCAVNCCIACEIYHRPLINALVDHAMKFRFWWIAYSMYKKFPFVTFFDGKNFEIGAHWFYGRRQHAAAIECLNHACILRPDDAYLHELADSWLLLHQARGGAALHFSPHESSHKIVLLLNLAKKYQWWEIYYYFLETHSHDTVYDGLTCETVAYYFYHKKRLDRAIKLMTVATQKLPNYHNYIEQLGDWISYTGDMERAKKHWHTAANLRRDRSKDLALDRLARAILKSDWTCRIGHFSYLDGYIKLAQLGLLQYKDIMLVTKLSSVANPALLRLFGNIIDVHCHDVDDRSIETIYDFVRVDLNYQLLKNGDGVEVNEGAVLADKIWRDQKRGPLISIDAEMKRRGNDFLREYGVGPDDWFVVVHAREPGYVGASLRDCDITTYLKAFEYITGLGGWVVRLGDATMKPLPKMTRVIDFTRHQPADPNLDIFLAAKARFTVGCASGMSYIPHIFGVPSLFVNWAPAYYRPVFHEFLFIPKTYVDKSTRKPLSFEQIAGTLEARVEEIELLHSVNIDLLDNTADEILSAVKEFIYILENHLEDDAAYFSSTLEFQDIARRKVVVGQGVILPSYLKNHPYYAPSYSESDKPQLVGS